MPDGGLNVGATAGDDGPGLMIALHASKILGTNAKSATFLNRIVDIELSSIPLLAFSRE